MIEVTNLMNEQKYSPIKFYYLKNKKDHIKFSKSKNSQKRSKYFHCNKKRLCDLCNTNLGLSKNKKKEIAFIIKSELDF